MSQLSPDRVFKGFWVDYSNGIVLGSTITATSNTATIIVAISSVLIAFTGKHLWSIIASISFAALTTDSGHEELHQQHRVTLRSIDSPAAMVLNGCKVRWQGRRHTKHRRCCSPLDLLTAVAALCSIGFVAAGVLSSQIVSNDNIDVLAYAPSCAFTYWDASDLKAVAYGNAVMQESIAYTHACYNASRSDSNCRIYTTQSIPFNTSYDECPFGDLCVLADKQALSMDTGLLWSNDIFGLNTRRSDALAFRHVAKCAPLNVSRYQTISPMDDTHSQDMYGRPPLADELMVNLRLGAQPGLPYNDTITATSASLNTSGSYLSGVASWWNASLDLFEDTPWYLGSSFDALEPLRSTEGDLVIISMTTNTRLYSTPVEDPFFSARVPRTFTYRNADVLENFTMYGADNLISIMGCTQQYQICTHEEKCTDLSYVMTALPQAVDLGLSSIQNATLYSFANAIINYSAGFGNMYRAPLFPLLANDGALRGQTVGLPANQWELEVKYWTAIFLATVQRYVTDFAAGHSQTFEYITNQYKMPSGPSEHVLCHAQKMKAPSGISNISVFGLSFTIALCGLIVLLNFSLMRMLLWLSKSLDTQWKFVEDWNKKDCLEFQATIPDSESIGTSIGQEHGSPIFVEDKRFHRLKG